MKKVLFYLLLFVAFPRQHLLRAIAEFPKKKHCTLPKNNLQVKMLIIQHQVALYQKTTRFLSA